MDTILQNSVWDIEKGNIVKLSEDKEVVFAIHGFKKLTKDELIGMYGEYPEFINLRWPVATKRMEKEKGAHWVLMGYNDACIIPVICQIITLIDKGSLK